MKINLNFFLVVVSLLCGCAHDPSQDDPLKNTKALVKKGHVDLYENGAFQVPSTHLYLIPPGPGVSEVAGDLVGIGAKASLSKALDGASDAYSIVARGTKASFQVAGDLSDSGKALRQAILERMQPNAILLISKSNGMAKEIIGESWSVGKKAGSDVIDTAHEIVEMRKSVEESRQSNRAVVTNVSDSLSEDAHKNFSNAGPKFDVEISEVSNDWVLGRAMSDKSIRYRENDYQAESQKSLEQFAESYEKQKKGLSETSDRLSYMVKGSFKEGNEEASESVSKGKQEWQSSSDQYGYTLGAIRAVGWYLKAALWDETLVPISKTIFGGVGYVVYNGVAWPVLIVSQGGNQAVIAVRYSALKIGNGFEYVAPTGQAALGGVLASAKWVGADAKAGVEKVGSAAVLGGGVVAVETLSAMEKGGAYTAEGATYVGVPFVVAGTTAAVALSGAVISVGGTASGAALTATDYVVAYGGDAVSKVAAGTTAVVGTTGSAVAGATVGVLEVAQGIVVAPALTLGSGVVLTYGALTQLTAQAILAASDCAYLVVSMEGPKAVVYGVKGLVHTKDDLPSGTVVDLQELRKRGEVIEKIPLSDEEIGRVMKATSQELPQR